MPNPLQQRLQTILRQRPPSGLPGAAFWLAVWFGLLWLFRLVPGTTGILAGVLQACVALALAVIAIPLFYRFVRNKMLWSLRSRLILTYLLIGLAPVLLGLTLATIFSYIAAGQFAIHLADSRLQGELEHISADNAGRTARVAHVLDAGAAAGMENRGRAVTEVERATVSPHPNLHPRTEVFLNGAPLASPDPAMQVANPLGLPPWAVELPRGTFRGIVLDAGELHLVAIDQQRLRDGRRFTLLTSLPVDETFLGLVAEGLGRARLFNQKTRDTGDAPKSPDPRHQPRFVAGGNEPPPAGFSDIRVSFPSTTTVMDWETGKLETVLIEVDSRPSLLYLQLFGTSINGIFTSAIRFLLISLCILFSLIEALALFLAIRVGRTMTTSVAGLYQATQSIDRGDLHHRIAVSRTDQLADLSRSFNRMTVSLQRLLLEQQEKERLQSELSIAQEVQANLFPTAVRDLPSLQLHGVCRPARSVSGDYYDFLVFSKETPAGRVPTGLGIALGDISGKGISAALLMATLHSAVRAYRFLSEQVTEGSAAVSLLARRDETSSAPELFESPGRIMALLNRHLYRSTQPEKYATLFLAHYDAASAWLTYSTAGQLPPLLLGRDGSVRRLDCGGTVVGLMDNMTYEEGRFQMHAGDILVAYSDGVTEPENDFGDFGEERLLEVVARYRNEPLHVISAQVMQALDAWIGAEEQPDDITLVLARQL